MTTATEAKANESTVEVDTLDDWGNPGQPIYGLYRNRATGEIKVFRQGWSWSAGLLAPFWALKHKFWVTAGVSGLTLGMLIASVAFAWGDVLTASIFLLLAFYCVGESANGRLAQRSLELWRYRGEVETLGVGHALNAEQAMEMAQRRVRRNTEFIRLLVKQPPEVVEQALALLNEDVSGR